ncbi:deoxyribose-phosphate aldolase [Pseudonocardia acaciae]|uniref:deoxyribose-phosphate aldolase n=1 Tax=Pseudonocardia acaciae TaxID=551276 RepID=UPI000AD9C4EB|nr:deoxyribose-phosphate aldolase [Pseudonocardia acaciae]
MIDHTLLKPEATAADIERLCAEAIQYELKAVCVNPYWASHAAATLTGSTVALCTVVGFPFGASRSTIKSAEATQARAEGATEIDMVVNLGAVKGGDFDTAESDIRAVRDATEGATLKVIIEATALTEQELTRLVGIVAAAGADFVKTSTGYHPTGGARLTDVTLIRKALGNAPLGIKASGGIRTYAFATDLIAAGATRLGASASIALINEELAATT